MAKLSESLVGPVIPIDPKSSFVDSEGDIHGPYRVMTKAQIREREELNAKNTASALRARVVRQQNGQL